MTRYFFDLPTERDEFGLELPDDIASRRIALQYAGEIIREFNPEARGQEYWRMDVRKAEDQLLFSVVMELLPARKRKVAAPAWSLKSVG